MKQFSFLFVSLLVVADCVLGIVAAFRAISILPDIGTASLVRRTKQESAPCTEASTTEYSNPQNIYHSVQCKRSRLHTFVRNDREHDHGDLQQPFLGGRAKSETLNVGESADVTGEDDDELLSYAIDSLLRGDYDHEFADDAPAPHPGLSPGAVVASSLRSLRKLDTPHPSHGAAVFLRFCLPLSRGERWGDVSRTSNRDPWKEVLRGAITPSLFARQLRSSEFSCLLDWKNLDVTEGAYGQQKDLVGIPSMAFVNAALYFEEGIEPVIIQFTLRRLGGVWLIDTARKSARELFVGNSS